MSAYLAPQASSRSRSKSPAGRDTDSLRKRDTSRNREDSYRGLRSAREEIQTPHYEERTPDPTYTSYAADDRYSRRPSQRADDYPTDRSYADRPGATRVGDHAVPVERSEDYRHTRRERDLYPGPDTDPYRSASQYSSGGLTGGTPTARYAPPQSSQYSTAVDNYAATSAVQPGQFYTRAEDYPAPTDRAQSRYDKAYEYKPQTSYEKEYNTISAAPAPKSTTWPLDRGHDTLTNERSRHMQPPASTKSPDFDNDPAYWDRRATEASTRPRRNSYHRERSPLPQARTAQAVSPQAGHVTEADIRRALPRLSVSGGLGAGATLGVASTTLGPGGKPPPSPLLEAYRGTYQTISPMPSPLALARRTTGGDDDLSDMDLSDDEDSQRLRALRQEKARLAPQDRAPYIQDSSSPRTTSDNLKKTTTTHRRGLSDASPTRSRARSKKSVKFYDPTDDAIQIAEALKGSHRAADYVPLTEILPWLNIDELNALKLEYKQHAKINGQGINLSKHIKARIPGNLGKALFSASLGPCESDAYWANCFYQSGASRRELLIEALIGRSNQQIREIKDAFKDKRYDDDLERCMKAELKADKFRNAVLLALEERRMPEGLALDMRRVRDDADDLHDVLGGHGGESEMIKILLVKSDAHLREVLRYYETAYRRNFAKDMLSKSKNLVVSFRRPRSTDVCMLMNVHRARR